MKKIFTKKELLNERAVEYDPQHSERMHPDIEKNLASRTHYLGNHPAFPPSVGDQHFEEKIASKRFGDILTKAKRYGGNDINNAIRKGSGAIPKILEIESHHKSELEQLAIELVKKEFGLKNELDLFGTIEQPNTGGIELEKPDEYNPENNNKPKSTKNDDGTETSGVNSNDEYEPEDIEDLENVEGEIKKRRIINSMIQGASKKGHYSFHLIEDKINAIDPRLINLYGSLMSINDLMYWMIDDETIRSSAEDTIGGKVKIGVSGDKDDPNKDKDKEDTEVETPKEKNKENKEKSKEHKFYVKAQGLMFPVLVHELIKGTMEVMSLHGLPTHPDPEKSRKLQQHIINKTDFLDAETWDVRLGPGIWEKFLDAIGEDDWDVRHQLYAEIIRMPVNEFNSFMKELLGGTKKGKTELAKLGAEIKEDIIKDKYNQMEYEKLKSSQEERRKKVEDDIMNQISNLLRPKND